MKKRRLHLEHRKHRFGMIAPCRAPPSQCITESCPRVYKMCAVSMKRAVSALHQRCVSVQWVLRADGYDIMRESEHVYIPRILLRDGRTQATCLNKDQGGIRYSVLFCRAVVVFHRLFAHTSAMQAGFSD